MKRSDSRLNDQLRKVKIIPDYLAHPAGSALIDIGGTKVICAVSFEPGVPPWMRAQGVPGGWVTCEYGLLPSSTHQRNQREASKGKQNGRTMEIQRLIGRSFRSVIDLIALGDNADIADLYLDMKKDETKDSIVMVGVDATAKQQEAIRNGKEVGVVSQQPYAMGYQTIWTALLTTAPKKSVEIKRNVRIDPAWIDSSNIDDPTYSSYLYAN